MGKAAVAVGCGFLAAVIAAGLVGGSFGLLEPYEMGIVQNTVQKGIDDTRVYTSGRYFLGLGKSFVRFPVTLQNIYFGSGGDAPSIIVRVPQGQVTIDASVQYSLNATKLIGLYRNFQTDYHRRLVTLASSTIQTALQQLDIAAFFTNRTEIQKLADAAIALAFTTQFADFRAFQLRRVQLPAANEASILNKVLSEVRQRVAAIVQTQQSVDAQTNVIVGQIEQEITVYTANKTNEANVILNSALAESKALRLGSEGAAYSVFQKLLGLNNTELLRYLYYRQLQQGGVNLAVGFDKVVGLV